MITSTDASWIFSSIAPSSRPHVVWCFWRCLLRVDSHQINIPKWKLNKAKCWMKMENCREISFFFFLCLTSCFPCLSVCVWFCKMRKFLKVLRKIEINFPFSFKLFLLLMRWKMIFAVIRMGCVWCWSSKREVSMISLQFSTIFWPHRIELVSSGRRGKCSERKTIFHQAYTYKCIFREENRMKMFSYTIFLV